MILMCRKRTPKMIRWRITSNRLPEVRGLLDLLICEFSKIKRQKFIRFSMIVSFVYAVVSFVITMMLSSNPGMVSSISSVLPIPIIFRWYLSLFPLEDALSYVKPYMITTLACFGILAIFAIVTVYLTTLIYKRKEI